MKLISSEGVRETNRMEVKMSNLLTVIESLCYTLYSISAQEYVKYCKFYSISS